MSIIPFVPTEENPPLERPDATRVLVLICAFPETERSGHTTSEHHPCGPSLIASVAGKVKLPAVSSRALGPDSLRAFPGVASEPYSRAVSAFPS